MGDVLPKPRSDPDSQAYPVGNIRIFHTDYLVAHALNSENLPRPLRKEILKSHPGNAVSGTNRVDVPAHSSSPFTCFDMQCQFEILQTDHESFTVVVFAGTGLEVSAWLCVSAIL